MFKKHRLRALIEINPTAARQEITNAFVRAACHRGQASIILACKAHTFLRWARELDLDLEEIEARAIVEGWHHGHNGGAQHHRDPIERVRRMKVARKKKETQKKAAMRKAAISR